MSAGRPASSGPEDDVPVDAWPGAGGPAGVDPADLDATLRADTARAVAERPTSIDADPWRQGFHVQPSVGLLNDPNGVVQHDGVYHLCFQWHPGAPRHGLKFWAYLTSTDLLHWTDHGVALTPSNPFDSHGCYSGSGFVHEGAVCFLYTGNVRTPTGERTPMQVLARVESDGSVVKDPANPVIGVIPGYSEHVRDPKVWQEDGAYLAVIGAQTLDLHGTALLLRSEDLLDWTLLGQLGGGAEDPVGGYMWECPDLMRFDGADVLVISAQFDAGPDAQPPRYVDETLYAVGALRVDPPGFDRATELLRMDHGPDFYAPQTFVDQDGRRLLIGWMGMPDHPGQPELAVKHPSVANGWVHCLTVPRTVSLELPADGDPAGGRLVQWPVAELEALRGDPVVATGVRIAAGTSGTVPGVEGARLDLQAHIRGGEGARLTVALRDGDSGRPVLLVVDPHEGTLTLDRTRLGTGEGGSFSGSFGPSDAVDVRVLLDSSSIEVFADGGRVVLSARIYPVPGDEQVSFDALGGDVDLDVTAWPLHAADA
jgi:beta-fructofuranosidase